MNPFNLVLVTKLTFFLIQLIFFVIKKSMQLPIVSILCSITLTTCCRRTLTNHFQPPKNLHITALILARGGSKGLKLKNLALIGRQTLLERAIKQTQLSYIFQDVYVSTEHAQIAEIAAKAGAKIHWRDAQTATDHAPSIVGVQEFLSYHAEVDVIALIQCTSPFLQWEYLRKAADLIDLHEFDCVFSVTRSFKLRWSVDTSKKTLIPINFDSKTRPRRQDWSGELIENGMFYLASKRLIQEGRFQNDRCGWVEIPAVESLEIDDGDDLEMARVLDSILRKR